MNEQQQSLQDLQHIKQMMERSSRFISLSGLSGIAAGTCALVGAWFANRVILDNGGPSGYRELVTKTLEVTSLQDFMGHRLFQIAVYTFIGALLSAFLFTYTRSRKSNVPMWGYTSRRLIINVAIPMIAGGIYLFRQMQFGNYGLIAPGCLIFYGLALVNASKYTLGEVRYLGYCQILLGIVNCWFVGYGLYFWAAGFGVLHIIYGSVMWYKYERSKNADA
ncbi:MAG TPA: hypothetical protein PLK54_07665 [Ferruginibacter sp.]|nr:hypothetical protein [Chitinophagales bacterium]HMX37762.1 hypothetical protein [Ferruginibacter sp.]HNF00973.1 hypothetical protein [Ferruginibacter sp.]HNG63616.1 hypothetical protein [Ferruginibacter sp.]